MVVADAAGYSQAGISYPAAGFPSGPGFPSASPQPSYPLVPPGMCVFCCCV